MRAALALGVILLLITSVVAAPGRAASPPDDVIELQTRLVDLSRQYKASLERMLGFEEADVARAAERVQARKELLDRGVVSRREVEESERNWTNALGRVEETRKRIGEVDALIAETLAAIEVAKLPQSASRPLITTPDVIRYQGGAGFIEANAPEIERFFFARFARPLPVSARGQTAVHDRMGLDHRHAMDVAVNPDSEEGLALIEYLRQHHIPFLAFRRAIPGASTGAHLHIGNPSAPLASTVTTGR